MEVKVNKIIGLDDSIIALRESKRHMTMEEETEIREFLTKFTSPDGSGIDTCNELYKSNSEEDRERLDKLVRNVFKWGVQHTTLLKYIMFSCSVYDLHRGAQDDFDAHAERLDSRIIRSSTRLARFTGGEKSDYYKGKIITTDEAVELLNITLPESITAYDNTFVKCVNGYVREDLKEENDVLRGLYMLSIPSSFIFQCNIVEFAHIVKLRDRASHANPELRQCIELILSQLISMNPYLTREFFYSIPN